MRVLVTRPEEAMTALKKSLQDAGHEVMCAPLLEISPIIRPMNYDGVAALAFTSANGVRFVPQLSDALMHNPTVYAVGPRTAITAKEAGFDVVMQAAGDVNALKDMIEQSQPVSEGRVVHFSGTVTKGHLVEDLSAKGYDTQRVEVYDAHAVEALPQNIVDDLQAGHIDAALFYSARTLAIFALLVEKAGLYAHLADVRCLCLSQDVANKADMLNWKAVYVAHAPDEPSMLKLVNEVAKGVEQK